MHEYCIDCSRELPAESSALGSTKTTPFIPIGESLTLSVQELSSSGPSDSFTEKQFRGVRFSNHVDQVSPHISRTHCECALHVLGEGSAPNLTDVLTAEPRLNTTALKAVLIPVVPKLVSELGLPISVSKQSELDCYNVKFGADDHYYIAPRSTAALEDNYNATALEELKHSLSTDRIVTQQMIKDSLEASEAGSSAADVEVICISLVGFEDCMQDWPFLTTTAVVHLLSLFRNARVVAINTPSIDRENDGGMVPNHKAVFRPSALLSATATARTYCDSNSTLQVNSVVVERLVIELAAFAQLGQGDNVVSFGMVNLNVSPHPLYADCGACSLSFAR